MPKILRHPILAPLYFLLTGAILWLLFSFFCGAERCMIVSTAQAQPATATSFHEPFSGQPLAPEAWQPLNWDVTVHSRDSNTWHTPETMHADHSMNCDPPMTNHLLNSYEQTVFLCRNHLMTALKATGYGVIYLTPNHLVDFSAGEAVIRFDVSTLRRSSRDWIDLWISPYAEHLQLPLDDWLPDLHGEPQRALHVIMDFSNQSKFRVTVTNNFLSTTLPRTATGWQGYEAFLTPSATQRETFELRLSRTTVKFGMPAHNFWWVDTTMPDLGWDQGVVQLGHHSYNPEKACNNDGSCQANTWHWDNVTIDPALPFTILRGDRRYVDGATTNQVNFAAPAPADSHLRFAGIGNQLEVSFDGGLTWQAAQRQILDLPHEEHFYSYWMPAPAGITNVQMRGQQWWGGGWHTRDFSLWSRQPLTAITPTATPIATETPLPTATPTATPVPLPTPTPNAEIIFADGFESGALNAWSANVTDGGDLSVAPSAALTGDYGGQVQLDDNNPIYLTDERPQSEPGYHAQFQFDPNALTMANGDSHLLFYGYTGNAIGVLRLEIRYYGGAYQLKAGMRDDGSQWATSPNWLPISDAPHTIELSWWAATAPGANNGALTFAIDGVQVSNFTGIDNDTRRIDRIQLGSIAGIDTGTRGVYFLDEFVSQRLTAGSQARQQTGGSALLFVEDDAAEATEQKLFLPLLAR